MEAQTLVDVLRARAAMQGADEALTFLSPDSWTEARLTYAELDRWARAIASSIREVAPLGSRVIILSPSGLEHHAAVWGALYAGCIAVPTHPPGGEDDLTALENVIEATGAAMVLSTPAIEASLDSVLPHSPAGRVPWLCVAHDGSMDESSRQLGHPLGVAASTRGGDGLRQTELAATVRTISFGGEESPWQPPAIEAGDIAFLLLSSGSTAAPKASMQSHRSLMAALRFSEPAQAFTSESRLLDWAAPHYTMAIGFLVRQILAGIPMTLLPTDSVLERPVRWLQAITRTRATHMNAPNYAYDLCLRTVTEEEKAELDLSSVVHMGTSGELIRPDTLERFSEAFAACGFRSEMLSPRYGSAEIVAISTKHAGSPFVARGFDAAKLGTGRVVPIGGSPLCTAVGKPTENPARLLVSCGRPYEESTLMIVNPATLQRCAPDEVGEIWVAGPHVARGYWQRPDETRYSFNAHLADTGALPPSVAPGPFFRTGDLGFLLDGELFIAGRTKDLIIIRGRNIYPMDVELAARRSHPALANMAGAAFSIEDEGAEHLVIVQEADGTASVVELVDAIRRGIASAIGVAPRMVALAPSSAIPRTSSGKIKHAACRDALANGTLSLLYTSAEDDWSARKAPYVPPTNELERQLVGIWEEVLGTRPIGVHDVFLTLGGDSLRSLQVLARMRASGITVSMQQLSASGTIAEIAESIRTHPAVLAPQEPVIGPVDLLLTQRSVLGAGSRVPADITMVGSFSASERIDASLLDRAAQHVIFHHDALRMRFRYTGYDWEAECVGHVPGQVVSTLDLSALPPDGPAGVALEHKARVQDEYRRLQGGLDIRRGPVFRISLVRRGAGPGQPVSSSGQSVSSYRDLILLAVPHLLVDAFCFPVLVSDLETAYLQLAAGAEVQLPAKTTNIRQWGARLRELAASPEMRAEASYWSDVLRDKPSRFPVDVPERSDSGGEMHSLVARMEQEPTQQLFRLASAHGFRMADAFLYAAARAVADRTGSHSLLLDIQGHGREPLAPDMDLSRTLGYFTTLVPVRVELDQRLDPLEATRRLHAQIEGIPHHGIGYDILRHLCRDAICDGLRVPHRPIRLNYAGVIDGAFSRFRLLESERSNPDARWAGPRTDLVIIHAVIVGGALALRIEYHTGAYHVSTMEELAASIKTYLGHIVRQHGL